MKKIILILFLYLISFLNSEAQWIQQNSGTGYNLYDIEFINEKTGWAVGDAGVVIKTTNGGDTWMNIPNPSPPLNPNLWSVFPFDSNIVYITSGKDLIIKTIDGGLNWNILNFCPECNSAMTGIYFLNKDTGWFLGTNKVFRTYDGGNTLDSFYVPWFTNFDVYFKDVNTGIFCGTGRVFKSTDGGENWFDTHVPNGPFYMFRKLAVVSNNVWIVGSSSPVFRSTDFCETWEITTPGQQIGGVAIHFVNENTGFIGRSSNNLIKSTNGGYNWYQQRTDSNSNSIILSIEFETDSIGWLACGSGKIYKTITGGEVLTYISSNSIELPNNFNLDQNYPNPFNNETNIEFNITENDVYILEIYNVNGQKKEEIFNKKINRGKYKIRYNAGNLSSGIYIYRISSNKLSLSKKFILIK
ncbi:MAG: T9SS type A sorting domain-containing protein [Ignavibacteria bacterium]|nr:T9SS type A sorting domain-containing protein [Ignavibacteria bacterium]